MHIEFRALFFLGKHEAKSKVPECFLINKLHLLTDMKRVCDEKNVFAFVGIESTAGVHTLHEIYNISIVYSACANFEV